MSVSVIISSSCFCFFLKTCIAFQNISWFKKINKMVGIGSALIPTKSTTWWTFLRKVQILREWNTNSWNSERFQRFQWIVLTRMEMDAQNHLNFDILLSTVYCYLLFTSISCLTRLKVVPVLPRWAVTHSVSHLFHVKKNSESSQCESWKSEHAPWVRDNLLRFQRSSPVSWFPRFPPRM